MHYLYVIEKFEIAQCHVYVICDWGNLQSLCNAIIIWDQASARHYDMWPRKSSSFMQCNIYKISSKCSILWYVTEEVLEFYAMQYLYAIEQVLNIMICDRGSPRVLCNAIFIWDRASAQYYDMWSRKSSSFMQCNIYMRSSKCSILWDVTEEVLEFYAMQYLQDIEQVLDIMIFDRGSPRVLCNAIFTRHRASAQYYDMWSRKSSSFMQCNIYKTSSKCSILWYVIEEVLEFYAMQYLYEIEQVLNIMICDRGSPRVLCNAIFIWDRASAQYYDMWSRKSSSFMQCNIYMRSSKCSILWYVIEEVLEFYAMQYLQDIEQVLNIMICDRGSPRVLCNAIFIWDRASAQYYDMWSRKSSSFMQCNIYMRSSKCSILWYVIEEVLEFYAMQYLYEIEQVLNIMICDRGSPRVLCNAIFTRHRASAQYYDMWSRKSSSFMQCNIYMRSSKCSILWYVIEEVLEFYAMQYLYEIEQVLNIMICDRGSPRVLCNAIFIWDRASAQYYDMWSRKSSSFMQCNIYMRSSKCSILWYVIEEVLEFYAMQYLYEIEQVLNIMLCDRGSPRVLCNAIFIWDRASAQYYDMWSRKSSSFMQCNIYKTSSKCSILWYGIEEVLEVFVMH